MPLDIDARPDEADALATESRAMPRECGESVRADDPMTGHGGIVAGPHDVADNARGPRAARDDADEAVGGDAAGRYASHDVAHCLRPRVGVHRRIMPLPGARHGTIESMKNLVPQRSSNPVLGDKTFDGLVAAGDAMTFDGTVNRSFALVLVLMAGALVSVLAGPGYMLPAAVAGFVLALVTIFRKTWAPVTAPLYAFAEGLFIGGISLVLEAAYPGIVIPAVSLTVGIFIAFLLIYRSHLVRVTDKLRIAVVAATGAVALVYLVALVLNLVGIQVTYLNEAMAGSGALGIGVNVLVIGIAAFNLLLDFDLIERGVAAGAPKYMEWYGAFALLVTLVWLYIELLRLLSRLLRR